jgi:ATP-dependent Clp protease ATP-binding subunit ClpC
MTNNQFSQRVSEILTLSREEAVRLNNGYIGPEHLFLGLLREGNSKATEILQRKFHIDLDEVKSQIEGRLQGIHSGSSYSTHDISLNEKSSIVLKLTILEARHLGCIIADAEHLLLAIMKQKDNLAAMVMRDNDIDYTTLVAAFRQKQDQTENNYGYDDDDDMDNVPPSTGGKRISDNQHTKQQENAGNNSDTPALDLFGIDITRNAREGKLDPVVGREREIERIAQILSRRKKNNPILIGEPGAGKTAIVEGLALRITQKKVSRLLFDKRIISLDLSSVVAGTKFRGQFEERMKAIINELQANKNIIVFIDEIHTLVGAGNQPGSMDAANIIKPALSRGDLQCIGATTLDEYRKSIEKDGALERRFQKIIVEPTTAEETLEILHNIKDRYEDHHNVYYTDEALKACVDLTQRYVSDRVFPDKAIDALDEAGSRVHINNVSVPKEIEEQEQLIEEARKKKDNAVHSQNYELAAAYRDQVHRLEDHVNQLKKEWESQLQDNRVTVDADMVAHAVSMMTGVPVQKLEQSEGIRMKGMATALKNKVISQDTAIDKLVRAIQRSRVGLKEPNHPIGSFLFLGPTGVGKTYLAKQLAEFMFGSQDAIIRIDMSEYMEKFTVSRLVGAPPGYVGYEEGGQLTERVRRHPYSIVLLDEIEKAHNDVYNLLLQVMDEGRLTDSNGRTVDFRNTVIIMTSNVGSRQLKEFGRGVGFNAMSALTDKEVSRSVIQKALNRQFSPEFLNRIDDIITFDQLDEKAIRSIVDLELKSLYTRVENMGHQLVLDESAYEFIVQEGYDIQFGARPLKRAIQTYLEDEIATMIIDGEIAEGDLIKGTFDAEKNKIALITEHQEVEILSTEDKD